METVLYAVFVATSARASVAELADMLQVRWQVLIWLWRSGFPSLASCRHACMPWTEQSKPQTRLAIGQHMGFARSVLKEFWAHTLP